MARSIIGVIVGYIVMFSLQVAAFMTIYNVKGSDWAFKHGSYQPSTQWTLTQFTVILLTAIIAGLVCALIAGRSKAPLVLAGLVLVLGLLFGTLSRSARPADTRPAGNVPGIEAMTKATHPLWFVFIIPLIGAVGIIVGGSLKRNR